MTIVGCSATGTAESNGLSIVASTNVWGDVAQKIAGDNATVTSIITSASQDPHSYEATARDQLAISQAALVIENGGGYDPFIDTLLAAAGNAETVVVLNASEASGLMPEEEHAEDEHAEDATADDAAAEEGHAEHAHMEGFNEHVWYSFEGVDSVAKELATELSTIDPDNAVEYEANYQALAPRLAGKKPQLRSRSRCTSWTLSRS
jgi:zinc/manganese transport system substrate-binding protein